MSIDVNRAAGLRSARVTVCAPTQHRSRLILTAFVVPPVVAVDVSVGHQQTLLVG